MLVSRRQLTFVCVSIDPFNEFLHGYVGELALDVPLLLEVIQALDTHASQQQGQQAEVDILPLDEAENLKINKNVIC